MGGATKCVKMSVSMLIAGLVAAALALGAHASSAHAETSFDVTSGDFTFTIWDEGGGTGSLCLTKYSGSASEVEVLASVTSAGVTYGPSKMYLSIGEDAFAGNTSLVKVAIPSGYKSISQNAFKGCTGLTEVSIADSVEYIGDKAFADCPQVTVYRFAGTKASEGAINTSGIGQDSAGNVYPGVTVYTVEGSAVDSYIKTINKTSVTSGNGNQITLVYEADPYAGSTVKPGAGQAAGAGTGGSGGSGGSAATTLGEDGTPLGKGASAAAAEKFLTAYKAESDPAGSVFGLLQAKMGKVTKTSIKLSWKKGGAAKFVVYGNLCGKKNKYVVQRSTTKSSLTIKKVNGKKVKKGTYYKFIIVALDKNGSVVSTSKTIHAATAGGKVGNDKKVTTKAKKNKVAVKVKKSFKLKAKAIPASKKLKVKRHRKVAYESSNTAVANVSAKGVVKGAKKGTCYVYAYAQDGACAKIKVTVK